jgi:DNA polymerase-3 subunit epsilon
MRMILLQWKRRYNLYRLRRKNLPAFVRGYLEKFLHLNLRQRIADTEFVIIDTETTGLNVKRGDRILSLSALRLKRGRIDLSETFHVLVNPDRSIPSKTAVLHGILPRMVNGKPLMAEVLPRFIDYIGSAILVGHHEWLDMSFLNWEMERLYGISLQNIVLDTALLDQALASKTSSFSPASGLAPNSRLESVAERYHVLMEEQHSSFWDALTTAQIFQKMIKEAEHQGIFTLGDLLKIAFTPPSLGLSTELARF